MKESKLEKLINSIESLLTPISAKLTEIHILQAVAQTMQIVVPIYVIGGFATLFGYVDIGFWQNILTNVPILATIFKTIKFLTLDIISLYIVVVLPYRYALQLNVKNPFGTIIINLASFLLLSPVVMGPDANISAGWLGFKGMFTSFLLSYVVVRLYKLLVEKGVTIKMPPSVPNYVIESFSALLPAMIIVPIFGVLGQLMSLTSYGTFHNMIYSVIQAPLQGIGSSFWSFLLFSIVGPLSFFLGIHGSSATAIWRPIYEANSLENTELFAQGLKAVHLFDKGTMATAAIGGCGSCLAPAILLLIFMKSKRLKEVGKVAAIPQLFNISEPMIFGLPIMLNPLLFIPYMSSNIVNCIVSWVTRAVGLVQYTGLDPSWTIPMVVKAFFVSQTPIACAIVQLCLIIVDGIIWYPFLKALDKRYLFDEEAEKNN